MSGTNGPSQRRMLGAEIGSLGREELITLARAVCGQAASFAGGHGNIHPENIFMSADGSPWLGARADHAPGEWTTDELEYMAPELFWSGQGDARADVYSIALMLYAGVTRGRLPFFACAAGEMTNELRAAALRRRMNGEAIPIPTIAGDKLGEVLKKALSFAPEERYTDTIELSMALEPCVGEGDAAAMAMFGKPERELSEVERTMAGILASYSADEAAAVPEPEPERAPQPEEAPEEATPDEPPPEQPEADAFGAQAQEEPLPDPAAETPLEEPGEPERQEEPETVRPEKENMPEPEAGGPVPVEVPERPEGQPEPPETPPEPPKPPEEPPRKPAGRPSDREEQPKSTLWFVVGICAIVAVAALALNFILPRLHPAEPVVPATPTAGASAPTPTPTATPTPTLTPTPTPTQTPQPEPTYELYVEDLSWSEAEQRCRELGGQLAVISDAEELAEITALAEARGIDFLWVGFYRSNGQLHWINGEEGYYVWGSGEPSVTDTDGTPENYGLLWHTSSGWIYNDSRNDPVADYPNVYSGRIGFVCEYNG